MQAVAALVTINKVFIIFPLIIYFSGGWQFALEVNCQSFVFTDFFQNPCGAA